VTISGCGFIASPGCRDDTDRPDVTINPDFSDSSDLVTVDPHADHSTVSIGPLRLDSGFFTNSREFVFLRQDIPRSSVGFNIWSLIIGGMNPGHSSGEWLAWPDPASHKFSQKSLPPFSFDPSYFSALYFVDARLHAHLLQKDSIHAYGVFSPDGKYVATIRDEFTSNLWSFDR
jgi:hypothetical protein